MTESFFQFNKSIINEIYNFSTSSFDLLFMNGKKGVSKSELIGKAAENLKEDNLVFRHFCFKNTVIDDFLLNLYDSLRTFALARKISLKKLITDDFKEKLTYYFKEISTNCIIIVENFENVEENVEIIDFISHLASFTNVKIIIVTRNAEVNLFRFKKIKMQTLKLDSITKEEFKTKIAVLLDPVGEELLEKFYEITQGLELYLKMAVKYCTLTDVDLSGLVDEFERKNNLGHVSIDEFMVSKFLTLTPSVYHNFFKMLCAIETPVSTEFIETYKLTNSKEALNYLSKNFLINFFGDEIYVKDYFRQYITSAFSIQEKVAYYQNLADILEKELTKSPKDRILRLSRESIRKEIERAKSLIPSINSSKSSTTFSYLGIASQNDWKDEKEEQKLKLQEKLNKIKERKNVLLNKNKVEQTPLKKEKDDFLNRDEKRQFIVRLLNSARNHALKYEYEEAILELLRALKEDFNDEFKIEILLMLAKNNEALNRFDEVQGCYRDALDYAYEINDERRFEIEFLIALLNKNLYRTDEAKKIFKEILSDELQMQLYKRKSCIELGQIYESEENTKEAIKYYEYAIDLSVAKDKETASKAYYRLGVIYDENGDYDKAAKYYKQNYTTSSDIKENKYYSASLTNLSAIYLEDSRYSEARDYLKLALMFDEENNDFENLYYTLTELAKISAYIEESSVMPYYKQALNAAEKLKDNFKIALVYFEAGQYYYDKLDDNKALSSFLNAKLILKKSQDKENIERINSRIEDIKIRLDSDVFEKIMEKYAENQ